MEKPILFNTEMVRAILDGRKAVTRRVIKGAKPDCEFFCMTNGEFLQNAINVIRDSPVWYAQFATKDKLNPWLFARAPCRPDDVLWVRETWARGMYSVGFIYPTEYPSAGQKWNPSIFMPKEAARIFLRVTDVRVERLQAITPLQAILEGISPEESIRRFKTMTCTPGDDANAQIEKQFSELWNRTIKPRDLPLYGWDANPWVWVIEFERLEGYKPNESNP